MGPRVTVILINYNGAAIGDVIARSVQAVNNQTYTDWEVVLVDDGSTDGSDVLLQSLADGERVFFTRTDQHRGVGAARNAGITLARGEYLAFLDNDAIPEPDWLAEIVKKMDEHPGYGACASRVMFFDRPDTINSLGSVLNELAHGTGVGMHELKSFYRPTGEIMYATGNGMVLRRSALDVIGGFDEGFRFYGHDDSDIGIRLRNAGYAIVQQPSAVVLHLHSTSKRQPGMPFWDQRNRIRFVLKHYAWWEVLWFTCHDLPLHLRLHNLATYIKVWLSALSDLSSLCRYRWQNRELGSYFHRFRRFFTKEQRYLNMPDNRTFARQAIPFEELKVGEGEEAFLYSGWYWVENWHGELIRWANPVASLRFTLPRPLDGLYARLIPHPALSQTSLRLNVYSHGESTPTSEFETELPAIPDDPSEEIFVPLKLPVGEYRLVFQTREFHIEDGFFPRKIGFGLSQLRRL